MLALDIGNSKVKTALFKGEKIQKRSVFDTQKCLENDYLEKEVLRETGVDCVAFSSVVPDVSEVLESLLLNLGRPSFNIRTATDKILRIDYDIDQLGSDRLANAVAAYKRYHPPLLVIDFGTATTYNIVRDDGTFAGGIIAPGIKTCIDFLIEKSGLLHPIELERPRELLGHTTKDSLLSGYYYTYIGQMKEIIAKGEDEIGKDFKIIGTGGLIDFATIDFPRIVPDRNLTLHGIRLIYHANRKE